MTDLYALKIGVHDIGDDHIEVELVPAAFDDRYQYGRAEWHHAMVYLAGIISRAALYVEWFVFENRCRTCALTRSRNCSIGSASTLIVDPRIDPTDAPWVSFCLPTAHRDELIDEVKYALRHIHEADQATFTEEQEASWREDASE